MVGFFEKFGVEPSGILKKGITVFEGNDIAECCIDSYLSFEYLISVFGNATSNYSEGTERFYRGVTNREYDLVCSLSVNQLDNRELEIIDSLYSLDPNKFSACKNDFEMVALMQHYGLPTRLLDFTRNPLVALWFACQKDSKNEILDSDGAVYLAFSHKRAPRKVADYVLKGALLSDANKYFRLDKVNDEESLTDYIFFKGLYMDQMLFLDAPIIDLRERNQQAVFLLGVNDVVIVNKEGKGENEIVGFKNFTEALCALKKDNSAVEFGKIHCYKKTRDSGDLLKIIIPKELKKEFLCELGFRGINESFIYPTLDNYCKEIKQQARWKEMLFRDKIGKYQ